MKKSLKTKIFLDGGYPQETKQILKLLGFLDGQTTNPSLIAKNPKIQKQLSQGKKLTNNDILDFYRKTVKALSQAIPEGSISIEVYADEKTTAKEMLNQARQMSSWINNAHIKFPITKEGLKAAYETVKKGIGVNLTLCFTQEQAAAVFCATKGAKNGQVFVSPFVGRLDDIDINGMDLIKNIVKMYEKTDHHVAVLTASTRNLNHFLYALKLKSDIITAPFKVIKEWVEKDMTVPDNNFIYNSNNLKSISYQKINLNKNWQEFNLNHELTNKGLIKFANDWNALII